MSQEVKYTEFHPRWYRKRISTYWWMSKPAYLRFILRELSSVFVGWFAVFTLCQIRALSQDSYEAFQQFAAHPCVIITNLISLGFIVFHAVTWFNLAPKAMVMRFRGKIVPPKQIVLGNYIAWGVVSLVVALIVLLG